MGMRTEGWEDHYSYVRLSMDFKPVPTQCRRVVFRFSSHREKSGWISQPGVSRTVKLAEENVSCHHHKCVNDGKMHQLDYVYPAESRKGNLPMVACWATFFVYLVGRREKPPRTFIGFVSYMAPCAPTS